MKKLVLLSLGLLSVGVAARARQTRSGDGGVLRTEQVGNHLSSAEATSRHALLFFVIPLWMVAGFVDYLFHRRSRIERTSGTFESVFHMLMLTEGAAAVVPGLFFEVNALLLIVGIVALVAHTLTT